PSPAHHSHSELKKGPPKEPQFQGHFPDNPVFPGVLLIEGMAQTAGVICMLVVGGNGARLAPYFLTIDKAKFRKPVYPGDTVEYHMTKTARRKNMWWYRGEAGVGGQIGAEGELGPTVTNLGARHERDRSNGTRCAGRSDCGWRIDWSLLHHRSGRHGGRGLPPRRPC